MYKVSAIGDEATILPFKAFGLETVACEDGQEAQKAVRRLSDECAVIFITEQLATQIPKEIERYSQRTTPAIVFIPSTQGSLGLGKQQIARAAEKACGVDIFGEGTGK